MWAERCAEDRASAVWGCWVLSCVCGAGILVGAVLGRGGWCYGGCADVGVFACGGGVLVAPPFFFFGSCAGARIAFVVGRVACTLFGYALAGCASGGVFDVCGFRSLAHAPCLSVR